MNGYKTKYAAGGSSPLARGLRLDVECVGREVRIIPARAGFTRGRPRRCAGPEDHPRSRGVYETLHTATLTVLGSSPLARGLRMLWYVGLGMGGIIPARAGFTIGSRRSRRRVRDHPRSRGVYLPLTHRVPLDAGSSPLARGLLSPPPLRGSCHRIIPARAGFTPRVRGDHRHRRDHPRSRGVYTCGSLESQRTRTLPDPRRLHCRPRARSAELR